MHEFRPQASAASPPPPASPMQVPDPPVMGLEDVYLTIGSSSNTSADVKAVVSAPAGSALPQAQSTAGKSRHGSFESRKTEETPNKPPGLVKRRSFKYSADTNTTPSSLNEQLPLLQHPAPPPQQSQTELTQTLSGNAAPEIEGDDGPADSRPAESPGDGDQRLPAVGQDGVVEGLPDQGRVVLREGIVVSDKGIAAVQRLLMERLNQLDWHKVDVHTRHWHAHAAIVLRDPRAVQRFAGNRDVLDYLVNRFVA